MKDWDYPGSGLYEYVNNRIKQPPKNTLAYLALDVERKTLFSETFWRDENVAFGLNRHKSILSASLELSQFACRGLTGRMFAVTEGSLSEVSHRSIRSHQHLVQVLRCRGTQAVRDGFPPCVSGRRQRFGSWLNGGTCECVWSSKHPDPAPDFTSCPGLLSPLAATRRQLVSNRSLQSLQREVKPRV